MFRALHVRLLVADFPACLRFYCDIYADLSLGNRTLGLFRRDLMAEAVGAADRPATAEAQGVTLVTGPQDQPDWGVRVAHFRDPDGSLIEINSALSARSVGSVERPA